MKLIRLPEEMRAWSFEQRAAGKSLGLVPTMGALHEAHFSLMRASIEREDLSVASIFVNPAQFGPNEDLDQYPRTWEEDWNAAEDLGIDLIYAPTVSTMYPEGYSAYIEVEGVQDGLCGDSRPHFFRGVATVVTKLFHAVQPDRAYFGQKDAQQAAVIRRMVRDLDFGIEIVILPIVREPDGLAMSSRNVYLGPEEREKALCLSRSLFHAKGLLEEGERDPQRIIDAVRHGMKCVDVDYIAVVDAEDIEPLEQIEGNVLLAVAARVGKTRLIDNITYEVPAP